MKIIPFIIFLILLGAAMGFKNASAQADARSTAPVKLKLPVNKSLTITYNLSIEGSKKTGAEEVYNGGNKTIFISNNQLRVRLVSLMRIQSIFFTIAPDISRNTVTIMKESGKDKYKTRLSWNDWQAYNARYNEAQYKFTEDTTTILSYLCKKVTIKLKDNKEIIAWYTAQFYNPLLIDADPAFAGIPGVVLLYQYKQKAKSITYRAAEINVSAIHNNIFIIPSKGFEEKKQTTVK